MRTLTEPVTTGRTAVAVAWLVHLYTAVGVVLAALIVMAAWDGQQVKALWLMLAALLIDGTDGTLARAVAVKTHVPWFDGAMLDNIVDYLTYAFAPMILLWAGGYLGSGASATVLAVIPLVASAYQFCRVDAKTDDHFFLGFPSYWNVVAFYVIVLDLPRAIVALVLVVCAVMVFVPVKYLYPSRTEAFRTPTVILTAVWMLTYAVLLWQMPSPGAIWVTLSLGYVLYYVAVSVLLTVRHQHLTR